MPGAWESWSGTKQLKTLGLSLGPLDCNQGNHAWGMGVLVWDQAVEDPRFVSRAPGLQPG
jgi:hypothetical protein